MEVMDTELDLDKATCRRLLSSRTPLVVLAGHLPAVSTERSEAVGQLVEGALKGNVTAARGLAACFRQASAELLTCLADVGAEGVEVNELTPRLFTLPQLATLRDEPWQGLFQWALVAIRESLDRPVAFPSQPVDVETLAQYGQAVSTALRDALGPVTRIKQTFKVSSEDIGRWTGVSSQAVSAWERGVSDPKPAAEARLLRLDRLSVVFAETLEPELIPSTFREAEVPLLGGSTYYNALDADHPVDVLIDVVRRGSGRGPETEAGARYLDGPGAAEALQSFEVSRGWAAQGGDERTTTGQAVGAAASNGRVRAAAVAAARKRPAEVAAPAAVRRAATRSTRQVSTAVAAQPNARRA